MKTATLNINLRVIFQYDEKRHSFDEAKEHAIDLAIHPTYGTIEEGVSLLDHEINGTEADDSETPHYPFFPDLEEALSKLTIRTPNF